ncbi:hypothetical protein ANCCEY_06344 [Ancylostoma ceylanicum]|uniref:Uncharacterized protein n=1 Tax=Ancylostoma ceylanicum TaxID=53326 RepID=A0A0D6LTR1_9BILA|nr:hypothetical protein ANCCEY_06344 [Ancylostoma ceylanicum]
MTYASPTFWLPFAEHVLRNLREVLAGDAKTAEDLETSAQWFVTLAGSLLSTTSENYIQYKDVCFEMIGLLVECKSKVAYNNGAIGLWYMLYMLSRVYPENSRYISARLNRPLSEWVPVREWATLHDLRESEMAWYVPGEKAKELVKSLLEKFVFPVVDSLQDAKMDRDSLKKVFTILSYGLSGSITCFSMPSSPPFVSPNTVLPWFKFDSPNPAIVNWDIRYPSGKNFREELVDVLEKVIERLVSSKREHSQVLASISRILHNIIHTSHTDSVVDYPEVIDLYDDLWNDIGKMQKPARKHYVVDYPEVIDLYDDLWNDIGKMQKPARKHYHQLDIATGEHTDIYNYLTTPLSRKVQIFVLESQAYVAHMRIVVDSPDRAFTLFHLRVLHLLARLTLNDYSEVRGEARSVLATLFSEYSIAKESIVEDILPSLSDPNSTKEQLKVVDYPEVIDLYDDLWNDIGKMQKPARKHYECSKLNDFCMKWLDELHKSGEWQKFKDLKVLEVTKEMRASKKVANQKEQEALVEMLLALFARKDLLHTRTKLCRAMLWRCQKEKCGLKTIKILIGKFVDDEEYLRERCADELSFWLKKNKPKTIRMNWGCPKKTDTGFLKCGLRLDNLPLVYDSENLPTTEAKWNSTVFFSKQFGSYKWPKFISVVVYASKPQLNRLSLSDSEKAIVNAFEDELFYNKWIGLLLIEKQDSKEVNDNTVWMVKYLLRNFPASDIIYERITKTLAELLKSRKRAEQRLAAELFAGVSKGTKYIGFQKLNKLWSWLAPAVDNLYNHMNADAYSAWQSCITDVLQRDDTRRFWWLIERFLDSMTRPAPTAWHQGISLKHVCTVLEANMNNDLNIMPQRFRLEGVDFWLARFEKKIDVLASNGHSPRKMSETSIALNTSVNNKAAQSATTPDYDSTAEACKIKASGEKEKNDIQQPAKRRKVMFPKLP